MKVRVRKGDTLWYYSQLFSIPTVLLIDSNRNCDTDNLQLGNEVEIPGYLVESYQVKPGDTVWGIANSRNLPLDAISILNQEKTPTSLKIGESLDIPVKVVSRMVNGKQKYNSTVLSRDIAQLCSVYPFLKCSPVGQSVLNKPLHHIRIGNGKKKIHWNASFHANEWITTSVLMCLVNDYALSLTTNQQMRGVPVLPLYEQVSLSIVPMVNPDGVDLVLKGPPNQDPYRNIVESINEDRPDYLGWKANIRGIDLNKHFPANWEIEKLRKEEKVPSPRDYPGDIPLTEPEAIAMAELAKLENFDMVVAIHTQGEEFYWGYEGMEPAESSAIAEEFERVSTYKSLRYVDSHAGFKDWFIQEFKRPGFTLELGKGINPLPLSQFDTIYQKTTGIFIASMYI